MLCWPTREVLYAHDLRRKRIDQPPGDAADRQLGAGGAVAADVVGRAGGGRREGRAHQRQVGDISVSAGRAEPARDVRPQAGRPVEHRHGHRHDPNQAARRDLRRRAAPAGRAGRQADRGAFVSDQQRRPQHSADCRTRFAGDEHRRALRPSGRSDAGSVRNANQRGDLSQRGQPGCAGAASSWRSAGDRKLRIGVCPVRAGGGRRSAKRHAAESTAGAAV